MSNENNSTAFNSYAAKIYAARLLFIANEKDTAAQSAVTDREAKALRTRAATLRALVNGTKQKPAIPESGFNYLSESGVKPDELATVASYALDKVHDVLLHDSGIVQSRVNAAQYVKHGLSFIKRLADNAPFTTGAMTAFMLSRGVHGTTAGTQASSNLQAFVALGIVTRENNCFRVKSDSGLLSRMFGKLGIKA